MKLINVVRAKDTLKVLANSTMANFTATYKVAKFIKSINEILESYGKQEIDLAKKYAEIDEKDNVIFKDSESKEAFMVAHNALNETEIDIKSLELKPSDFGDNLSLTPIQLIELDGLINIVE